MSQEVAEVRLNRGFVAIIDAENLEWLQRWNWNVTKQRNSHSACAVSWTAGVITMHWLVLRHHGVVRPPGFVIDHINGNGLDNRFCNLRIATYAENAANSRKRRQDNTTSEYKGVWLAKDIWRKKRWVARIRANGKRRHLGHFATQEEAAVAYDAAAKDLYGEFAVPNIKEK